jgi:hypothetical protein
VDKGIVAAPPQLHLRLALFATPLHLGRCVRVQTSKIHFIAIAYLLLCVLLSVIIITLCS